MQKPCRTRRRSATGNASRSRTALWCSQLQEAPSSACFSSSYVRLLLRATRATAARGQLSTTMCGFFLAARPHQVRLHRLLLPLPHLTCLLLLRLLWLFLMLLRFLAKRVARCFLLFHFFPLDCQLATPPGPVFFSLSPAAYLVSLFA